MGNIKPFKGQVKISDIEEAFDYLVNSLNAKIQAYNDITSSISDINLDIGKAELGPTGYVLSIGGLKSILKAYGTFVVGCSVFYTSSNQVVVSGGVVFYSNGNDVTRVVVPRQLINGVPWNAYGIYLDKNTGTLTLTKSNSTILVRRINHNRYNNNTGKYRLENTMPYLVEDIGNYRIRIGDNNVYPDNGQTEVPSTACRFAGLAEIIFNDSVARRDWFFNGAFIGFIGYAGVKAKACFQRLWLWLPRSISNPLSFSGGHGGNTTKWFTCGITR